MKKRKSPPLLIVSVLGIVIGPLLFNLPWWVAGWCLSFWGYTLLATKKDWPWPNRTVRLFLTSIGFMMVLVFLGGGVSLSGQTFIGLLSVMAGLKPLEIISHRDRVVTLFMAYFIIISSLFIIENLFITLYMFISVLATTACLVHFNLPQRQLRTNLRLAAIIMIQAIPLMVMVFILFPRAEGTFFSLPGRYQGRTGFSATMQPGSISNLVLEDKTAFRAQFQDGIPEAASLYWRGLALYHFDGKAWTQGSAPERYQRRVRGQKIFQYEVILEPHGRKHLFALDLPLSSPPLTRLTQDYTLTTLWPVRKAYRYPVRSSPDARIESMGNQEKARQLPASGNTKAKSLAATWLLQLGSPEAVLDQAVQYFKQNEFSYTLKPPLLGENPVDDFLFDTKSGYCEHFASAFAYLMRAANIPARVVVGYLGGEQNPYGNYLIVKQYHAHAWVEAFLDNQGWVRVDPTVLVVPERVSMGLAGSLLSEDLPDFLNQTDLGRIRAYFRRMTYIWDAINLQWNAWFMEYSRTEQMFLLVGFISKITWRQVISIVGLAGLLAGISVLGWLKIKRRKGVEDKDPVKEAYDRFCRKLEGVGITREPAQGPVDFARKAGLVRSELKDSVERICHHYIALRYMGNPGKATYPSFLKMIQTFNPK